MNVPVSEQRKPRAMAGSVLAIRVTGPVNDDLRCLARLWFGCKNTNILWYLDQIAVGRRKRRFFSIEAKDMKQIIALVLLIIPLYLFAHPGGRDTNGGHVDRSTGVYHCHAEECIWQISPAVEEDVLDAPDGDDALAITIAGSWGTAKAWARDIAHKDVNTTFYCNCTYSPSGRSGGSIEKTSCGYDGSNESHAGRADRLEWEHVVPASLMPARKFDCWNEGLPECSEAGRECCEKHDLNARIMILDLHNLAPSIGQTNALRSNKRYGLIDGENYKLGSCDFEWSTDIVEPKDNIRGDVARVWLYFADKHNLILQKGELRMFMEWSNADPPTAEEFAWNDRIKEKQGNGNHFIEAFPRN
ncbi:MAG: endonuclease [Candidatus Thiodiazotropha sp. (ex Lucinoma aequizonata)]|nr:endonuclease [Candidatus Thiodiazotropha sp. (ex Lucinoma aequizonata)]MCU7889488.1 endonuclease [Candidatus Thiodiazotropha sp. (ex Lucinoma aequizonata)]MCU7895399.1 endonuclease [Candidatus Thiodiazotropha sp. (ex Lucinoma aequizonata)]MCU7898460.1 endonuclease [Candidatus Thiodiazotropha sp. (ex Lucinoma aequizonata)]MCU7901174.1 endonuclease [Candidatus Thiodiazotropha sp. (ex Lucinoma aequizonata)]